MAVTPEFSTDRFAAKLGLFYAAYFFFGGVLGEGVAVLHPRLVVDVDADDVDDVVAGVAGLGGELQVVGRGVPDELEILRAVDRTHGLHDLL